MKPTKRWIILITAIPLLSLAILVSLYGNIVIYIFARCNNLSISYTQLKTTRIDEFLLKGFSATEDSRGMGFSASEARIKLLFNKLSPPHPTADLTLRDVRMINNGAEKETSYSNIDGLIAIPFSGLMKYNTVSGNITPIRNGISVRNLIAEGDDIRFSFDGVFSENSEINADIAIYFAKSLLGKIPPELANMVLKDSDGQWKSFAVKLEGDLAKPAIKVTGKLFRLNIGVK